MCEHENFQAWVQVGRLTDGEGGPVTGYCAEMRVTCMDCGLAFGFLGPPAGLLNDAPTCSPDGLELRIPIVAGEVHRTGAARYELSAGPKVIRHA